MIKGLYSKIGMLDRKDREVGSTLSYIDLIKSTIKPP